MTFDDYKQDVKEDAIDAIQGGAYDVRSVLEQGYGMFVELVSDDEAYITYRIFNHQFSIEIVLDEEEISSPSAWADAIEDEVFFGESATHLPDLLDFESLCNELRELDD